MKSATGKSDTGFPDVRMIEMLVCPMTKTQLMLTKKQDELVSRAAGVAFPISKGVPLLCLDEARNLSQSEIEQLDAGKSL